MTQPMPMSRQRFAVRSAIAALQTPHGARVLSERLENFNDPDNPVSAYEVLQTLEGMEEKL